MMDDIEITDIRIYSTKNYSLFKILDCNRKLRDTSKLEHDILECDKLAFHPIVVDTDFNVIDGQHRLQAAQHLGKTIYFLRDTDGGIDDLNRTQNARGWACSDYVRHWAKRKRPSYILVEKLMEIYPLSTHIIKRELVEMKCGTNILKKFNSGEMELRYSGEFLIRIFHDLKTVLEKIKCYTSNGLHAAFETAVLRLVLTPNFDTSEMVNSIDRNPDKLLEALKYKMVENILQQLARIYNHKKSKSKLKV